MNLELVPGHEPLLTLFRGAELGWLHLKFRGSGSAMESQDMADVVPLHGDREGSVERATSVVDEQECWDGFWSVLGRAAYRVWLEEGSPARENQAARSSEAA